MSANRRSWIVGLIRFSQRERTPAPNSNEKFARIVRSGQLPWEAKCPLFLFFDNRSTYFARDEGRSLQPDDDLGALRESERSPSSGEVCLEVCSRQCSRCLHLFFSITIFHFHVHR